MKTRSLIVSVSLTALQATQGIAQSINPVGPAGWTLRNWMGLAVQIAVFVLAVIGVCKLANLKDE